MNLLSRGWWTELTADQVQQMLVKSSDPICLCGRVSNVNPDQTLNFKILCKFTWETIKLDLTLTSLKSNQIKKDLIDTLNSGEYYIWIKGKVTSFSVLTVRVKEWGFCWGNLLISKSLEYDLKVSYENLSDDARKWVDTLESSTNPRVKQLLEWWYWQGSGRIKGVNPSPIDTLKFWGLTTFIPIYTGISIPQSIRKDFVLFKRALLLASMRLVEND
jgi:hypothetical protein